MRNSKIWTIIQREYVAKIKTKGFIIATIVSPLAMIAVMVVPALIAYFSMTAESDNKLKIAIADYTNSNIGQEIVNTYPEEYEQSLAERSLLETEKQLKQQVLDGKIGGALLLYQSAITDGKAKIFTGESTGLKYINDIKDRAEAALKNKRLAEANISQEAIDLVNSSVQFETIKVTASGTSQDDSEIMSFVGYFFGFIMYGLMFIYGSQVMQGVMEEKSSRIIEILMSSARPFQIMFGKVIGIGAVGLTQVLFWLILLLGLSLAAGYFIGPNSMLTESLAANPTVDSDLMQTLQDINIPNISPWVFVAFVFYFLSGYFIYATLFASIGAAIDHIQDANSLSMPLTILVIIPIMCIPNVMLNPEGIFATVISLVPFFTPILMIARVTSISVPIWQIGLSVVLLVATFLLCLKFAAKIYRIGMLSYGKKPSLKDLAKWAVSK